MPSNITNNTTITGASAASAGLVPPRNNTRRGLSDTTNHHISFSHTMAMGTNGTTNKRKRSSPLLFVNPDSDSDDEGSNNATHLDESTIRDQSLMDSLQDEEDDSGSTDGQAGAASGDGGGNIRQHKHNKKRRTTIGGAMMTAASSAVDAASSTASWQAFSRQGTQFKAILDDALVKVANAAASNSMATMPTMTAAADKENSTAASSASGSSLLPMLSSNTILQKLAQEKQTDNLLLKQQLDQQKTETVTLQALLDDMQSNKHEQAAQITRLTVALKRAAANATQAREDADTAEGTAAQLSGTVDALETVVQETKRASQQLLEEQDQVRQAAQGMETKFVQAQTDLARSNATKHKVEQEQRNMKKQLAQLQERLQTVTNDLNQEKAEKQEWKRQTQEFQTNEKLQQERMDLLEKELQDSKKTVSEVTAIASETQEAKHKVESTLDRLQEVNQQLSDKLQETQQQLKRQDESHTRALAQAQKENQTMKQKWNSDRDLVQSLRIEKQAADKKVVQLHSDLSHTERRLLDSTSITGLTKPEATSGTNTTDAPSARHGDFVIPSLGGSSSKENPNLSPAGTCSICNKKLSKSVPNRKCACKRDDCDLKAHVACVNAAQTQMAATSVSHPGTPAPKLPTILCGRSAMALSSVSKDLNGRFSIPSIASTAVTPAVLKHAEQETDGASN